MPDNTVWYADLFEADGAFYHVDSNGVVHTGFWPGRRLTVEHIRQDERTRRPETK